MALTSICIVTVTIHTGRGRGFMVSRENIYHCTSINLFSLHCTAHTYSYICSVTNIKTYTSSGLLKSYFDMTARLSCCTLNRDRQSSIPKAMVRSYRGVVIAWSIMFIQ